MFLALILAAAPLTISAPPAGAHPFYKKATSALGLSILSSKKVSDAGLREAAFIVSQMLVNRPELAKRIADAGVHLVVMAPTEMTTDVPEHSDLTPKEYWNRRARGLGATVARPAISCAEENLLSFPGDPYSTENICVHEFAHVVAQFALIFDPGFLESLEGAYRSAHAEGLWKGTYADSNVDEYWAEAVQSYFDTNRVNDGEHGPIGTREQLFKADPRVAKLIEISLGKVAWRYRRVAERSADQRAALGALPNPLPTFVWPASAPPMKVDPTLALEKVAGTPPASPRVSEEATSFTLQNATQRTVMLWWVDFDGKLVWYGTIEAGRTFTQQTYVGHRWLVRAGDDVLGQFVAPSGARRVVVSSSGVAMPPPARTSTRISADSLSKPTTASLSS